MVNLIIPETKWTKRVWFYAGFTRKAVLGKRAFIEFIEGKLVEHFDL